MAERLQAVRVKIDTARDAVRGDNGASPVLVAVVNEFAKKADKSAAFPDERSESERPRTSPHRASAKDLFPRLVEQISC